MFQPEEVAIDLISGMVKGGFTIATGFDGARIIQVYGGCGPYGHRGPYGGCRTGGQWGGYVRGRSCPAGFHIGPYGRRCWPN